MTIIWAVEERLDDGWNVIGINDLHIIKKEAQESLAKLKKMPHKFWRLRIKKYRVPNIIAEFIKDHYPYKKPKT